MDGLMCLGIAGRVVSFDASRPGLANADVEGATRTINVALLDELAVGDWVLIHLGFALERLSPEEAAETRRVREQIS
jgi:hydrogenase expression/formation protein HypC